MAYADVNGARLWYEERGSGDPVVFLHAGLLDARQWERQLDTFSPRYRAIAFDTRGYGRSPAPEEPYRLHDDLLGLLDALELERAAFVGNSMGGKTAIDATLARQDRVSALVAVGAAMSGLSFRAYSDEQGERAETAWLADDFRGAADVWLEVWAPLSTDRGAREIAYANAAIDFDEQELDGEPPAVGRLGELRVPTLVAGRRHRGAGHRRHLPHAGGGDRRRTTRGHGRRRPPAEPEPSGGVRPARAGLPRRHHAVAVSFPTGTVTFLFTDIEGSTAPRARARSRLARAARGAPPAPARGVRRARRRRGRHPGRRASSSPSPRRRRRSQRPSTLSARLRDSKAFACASASTPASRATARAGYVGLDVHRAARVGAAGHGGQVLISQATRELVPRASRCATSASTGSRTSRSRSGSSSS